MVYFSFNKIFTKIHVALYLYMIFQLYAAGGYSYFQAIQYWASYKHYCMAPKSNNTIHMVYIYISFGNFTSRLKILDKYLQKTHMNIYIQIQIYNKQREPKSQFMCDSKIVSLLVLIYALIQQSKIDFSLAIMYIFSIYTENSTQYLVHQ